MIKHVIKIPIIRLTSVKLANVYLPMVFRQKSDGLSVPPIGYGINNLLGEMGWNFLLERGGVIKLEK